MNATFTVTVYLNNFIVETPFCLIIKGFKRWLAQIHVSNRSL